MPQKIKAFYCRYPDICAVSAIIAVFFLLFAIDMLLFNHGTVWGSVTDWSCQHFAVPEYLRMRFYETHDIFPDFAMQLGAGQNIYNLSYYGIMNPLYLPAYLMPWMTMGTYIQIVSIATVLISSLMAYYFFKKHFTGVIPLVLAVMFICAGPIVYHSHRHVMFVSYFPFLFGLLFTVRGSDSVKRLMLTTALTFCIICTSFYFSIGALTSAAVYMIYLSAEREERFSFALVWRKTWKKLLFIALGCICSSVMWLPSIAAAIMGRAVGASDITMLNLIVPSVRLDLLLYVPKSSGVTCAAAVAVIAMIIKGKKHERFLAAVILSFILFPVFTYILNGTMYIDGKVFIPFIPLILLLCGSFFCSFIRGEINAKVIVIIFAAAVIVSLVEDSGSLSQRILLSSDMLFTSAVLICGEKSGRRNSLLIQAAVFSVISGIVVCGWDKLAKRGDMDEFYSSDASSLVNEILSNSSTAFRFAEETGRLMTVNRIYRTDYLTTNIYSSVSNKSFRDFRLYTSDSDVNTRNNAIQLQPMNIIFNSLMGCRYRLTTDEGAMFGETEKAVSGKYRIYENENALPIGYASSDIMSENEYFSLSWEQRQEAILSNIIVPGEESSGINPHCIMPIKMQPETAALKDGITDDGGIITVDSSKPISIDIKLDRPVNGKLLLIRCLADNRIGRTKNQNDVILAINGVRNKLSAPTWRYHNGNYDFTYIISSNESIESLNLIFSEGSYTLSSFEAYMLDGSVLEDAKNNKDEFVIGHKRPLGDKLSGKIDVTKDGWFTVSLPYDKNFHITVDGKKTEYVRTNTAFIGFPISAGEHEIDISYEAPMKKAGIALGASALLTVFILLFIFGIHDRNINVACRAKYKKINVK